MHMLVKGRHLTIFRANHRRCPISNYAHKLRYASEDYIVMPEQHLIPLSGLALNGNLQVFQTLQSQMLCHVQIYALA